MSGPSRAIWQISDGQSVALDAIRLVATFAVFLGHASTPFFADTHVSLLGKATIPIFMMLSGYLTANAFSRGGNFFKKVIRRYVGLYFVVVPAFFIVLIADVWLVHTNSIILDYDKFDANFTFGRFLREISEALTYTGEYWRLDTVSQGMWSNAAYWTLDYIMAYTTLTAALYLLSGWQRIAVFLVMTAIAGPTVLLLSPLWWAGVVAYEMHRLCALSWVEEQAGGRARPSLFWAMRHASPTLAILGIGSVYFIEVNGLGDALYRESKMWVSHDWRQYLGMAKRFAWQWTLIPGLFLVLIASKYVITWSPSEIIKKRVRLAAQFTLPIYATHFTLLFVFRAAIPTYQASWSSPDPWILTASALGSTLLIAWICLRWVKPEADRWIEKAM